ncbi:MazG nucleotide pyrophosphohydrolase domain-containing protein [Clostridiaceae bacterium M8S5]|nr:MazG nucleotide pyrophosphohydrolase domain-containing protein [Clostridiaceae bacterium M8S5]
MNKEERQINLLTSLIIGEPGLENLQDYIKKIIEIRGLSEHNILEEMLMLIEEVGELAKSIRKYETRLTIDKDREFNYDTVESEIADILIVLVNICNVLDINLKDALIKKERCNINRRWD